MNSTAARVLHTEAEALRVAAERVDAGAYDRAEQLGGERSGAVGFVGESTWW